MHYKLKVLSAKVERNEKYWDEIYKTKSSTIHADLGCIVEQNTEYNGNMHT